MFKSWSIQGFLMSYLLLWPALIRQKNLEKKNSTGCLLKTNCSDKKFAFSRAHKLSHQITIHSVFHQPAEFFFSKKICQMKACQNMICITRSWSLMQVWGEMKYSATFSIGASSWVSNTWPNPCGHCPRRSWSVFWWRFYCINHLNMFSKFV